MTSRGIAVLLLAVAVVFAGRVVAWGFVKTSLFEADANVVELEVAALRHVHPNANRCPWFVLFYDAMCGHCRAFAPELSAYIAEHVERRDAAAEGDEGVPILFAAVNCANYPDLCGEMNISTVPTMLAAVPDSELRQSVESSGRVAERSKADPSIQWRVIDDRNNIASEVASVRAQVRLTKHEVATCTSLAEYLKQRKQIAINQTVARPVARIPGFGFAVHKESAFVPETRLFRQDIANAFFVTMRHEVAMATPSADAVAALVSFLAAVDASLPQLRAARLLSKLDSKPASSELPSVLTSRRRWRDAVVEAGIPADLRSGSNGTDDHDVEWRTCRGSSWKERGLPCGLWLLYHALVQNASPGRAFATLLAIRAYIAHYFVCYECRTHFASIPFRKESEPIADDEAVLWLWDAHNQVNVRLAVEKSASSDPALPKKKWPTTSECDGCFNGASRQFYQPAVLAYLKDRYVWSHMADATDPQATHKATQPPDQSGAGEPGTSGLSPLRIVIVLLCAGAAVAGVMAVSKAAVSQSRRQRHKLHEL